MLSPRYLDGLTDEISETYSQLENDILCDMAKRIARLGKITDATKWQAQMLAEAGGLKKNIARILKRYDKKIIDQVTRAFTDALETSAKNDNRIFKDATGRTVSSGNAQQFLSTIQKCHSDLQRLTLTTAYTTETQFVRQANRSYMMTQSGAFDYDTAMEAAALDLAKEGITTVAYRNTKPVNLSIETAVRMNILTSINQTCANQTLNNADILGVERFEVTAHKGARPEHEAWQGKIFTRDKLYSECGLGSVTGLCGINCRHSFYPYIEGTEKQYTQEDLDELAGQTVTFTDKDGNKKELTRYEGEQYLRHIEHNIRHYKRLAVTQEAFGRDNTKARKKIGEWQARARDFTEQTNIARDRAREWIATKDGTQPRGIGTAAKEKAAGSVTAEATLKDMTQKAMAALVDNPKSAARTRLETLKVEEREIVVFEKPKTELEIINRLGGADLTSGSCSSVSNAYIANKGGFDVLDFRGGKSLEVFSEKRTSLEMAKFKGVNSVVKNNVLNQIKAGQEMLDLLEIGKEYKLGVGGHAAIVRKLADGTTQYLELQDENHKNGWYNFEKDTFKERFKCKINRKYSQSVYLIELESLAKSKEFIKLMQYLNTSENAQKKGAGGSTK